jgi:hypothetical protein
MIALALVCIGCFAVGMLLGYCVAPSRNEHPLREFALNFREWYANHFEDFDAETNAQLLCLDNEAATALEEDRVT